MDWGGVAFCCQGVESAGNATVCMPVCAETMCCPVLFVWCVSNRMVAAAAAVGSRQQQEAADTAAAAEAVSRMRNSSLKCWCWFMCMCVITP